MKHIVKELQVTSELLVYRPPYATSTDCPSPTLLGCITDSQLNVKHCFLFFSQHVCAHLTFCGLPGILMLPHLPQKRQFSSFSVPKCVNPVLS